MASIMNYVVNNLNQVPTYCYAEENLVADSHSKATSTEEFVEVSAFSPGQTFMRYNNNSQPKRQSSDIERANSSNTLTNYFNTNSYPALGCASSIKASSFSNMTEATANNPFLVEDPPQPAMNEVDFNEATKKMFMQIWQENIHLQGKLLEMFRSTLKRSPTCKFMLNNHLMVQYQFNRTYKIFEQALIADENEAITTSNLSRSETTNNIDAQRTLLKSNGENFISQKIADSMSNTLATINPFNDFYKPIHQTAYNLTSDIVQSANRDGINQSQADESSSYVQMPPVTLGPSSLISNNYESVSSMMPTVSNTDTSSVNHCPPGFFQNVNTEYVYSQQKNKDSLILKETNPFKLCLANELQMSQTQNEHTIGYDTTISTSCLSNRNLQNYSPKMEFATNYNPHRRYENFPTNESKSGFAPTGFMISTGPAETMESTGSTGFTEVTGPAPVNVNHDDNYTSKIVYKASPVMYNTQKKKAEADITNEASSCNDYSNDTAQNSLHSGQYNKKEQLSHLVKYIDIRQPECINIIPHDTRNVSSTLNDNSTLNNENYIDTTYQNRSSLQNHRNSNCSLTMTNPSPYKEWNNNNNGKEYLIRNMNGMINSIHTFQFDSVNNENSAIMYANLLSLFFEEQKSTDYTNISPYTHNTLNTGFSFRRIDSVKGVTIIFNMEENGWMLTYEFAETFTNFKSYSDLISMLQAINLTTVLKNIQRSDYPIQFLQLDSYPLRAIRDSEHRITDINLISLPAVLVLLCNLRIISYEEIDSALRKNEYIEGSVMHNMWVLANTYKAFKQRIGQYNISYNT